MGEGQQKMKTILCLDLGTQAGWAYQNKEGTVFSGSHCFKGNRFEGGGMRYLRFSQFLSDFVARHPLSVVYFEEVRRHVSTDSAHAYGGFLATLTSFCEANLIPYEGIPVGTIKKALTGKGNASKQEMINAIKELGYKPKDDNEADALAILKLKSH